MTERQAWAVERLGVQPDDVLLEVGCGHGVAVSAVCERLTRGRVLGIDRSQKMIDMAAARNADHVAAGRAAFRTAVFEEEEFAERFDKVYAFHVAAFWRKPEVLLPLTARLLQPGGTLHLFNQMPGWNQRAEPAAFAGELAQILQAHGFTAAAPVIEAVGTGQALAVAATRSPVPTGRTPRSSAGGLP
jgi:ubiquinone/menaquinone biosynthesis C-methylase UbiE